MTPHHAANSRPNELPNPVESYSPTTAPLVIDSYLDRCTVIDHIADELGLEDVQTANDGWLPQADLVQMYRTVADGDSPRMPSGVNPGVCGRHKLIKALADSYGFTLKKEQDTLLKTQLVYILITEACGESPGEFRLPSDPAGIRLTEDG